MKGNWHCVVNSGVFCSAGKLAALEEFQLQKEELMGNLSAMKEQLEEQKEEHRNVIYNLEKKAVLDNDRSLFRCSGCVLDVCVWPADQRDAQ